ncbi:hypothetical protein V1512DRAFT_254342 [Lipomyces arxii]|uniref:uncharacterized protein n=1 Tax=Lipomyces arxii TaxID=56418 RepID=UPI0034CDE261
MDEITAWSSRLYRLNYDLKLLLQTTLIRFHSPYPEIRAIVCHAAFINQIFHQREPNITLKATILQVLIFSSGQFIAPVIPHKSVKFFKWSIELNPGPWTFKEQLFAIIVTNIGAESSNYFHYGLALRLPIFFGFDYADYGFFMLIRLVTFSLDTVR